MKKRQWSRQRLDNLFTALKQRHMSTRLASESRRDGSCLDHEPAPELVTPSVDERCPFADSIDPQSMFLIKTDHEDNQAAQEHAHGRRCRNEVQNLDLVLDRLFDALAPEQDTGQGTWDRDQADHGHL